MSTNSERPKIRRQTIVGNEFTPIVAEIDCDTVSIGNAGSDNLTVYSLDASDGDTDKHLIVPSGFERTIRTGSGGWRKGARVVNVKRGTTGEIVLIWG